MAGSPQQGEHHLDGCTHSGLDVIGMEEEAWPAGLDVSVMAEDDTMAMARDTASDERAVLSADLSMGESGLGRRPAMYDAPSPPPRTPNAVGEIGEVRSGF